MTVRQNWSESLDRAAGQRAPINESVPIFASTFSVKIPAGTKIYVGDVGYQSGFYLGVLSKSLL